MWLRSPASQREIFKRLAWEDTIHAAGVGGLGCEWEEERKQRGAGDGICRALIPGRTMLSAPHALSHLTLSPVARGSSHNYSWLEGMEGVK